MSRQRDLTKSGLSESYFLIGQNLISPEMFRARLCVCTKVSQRARVCVGGGEGGREREREREREFIVVVFSQQ